MMKTLIIFMMLTLSLFSEYRTTQQVATSNLDSGNCTFWHSKVDPNIKPSDRLDTVSPGAAEGISKELKVDSSAISSEEELFKAIECLLHLEGNKTDSKIIGATSYYTSQVFGASTVEVAALYYISYLYYGKWDHAYAAKLVDKNGFVEDSQMIHKAYVSYRNWYKKLKEVGTAKAKETKLDPLAGTGIGWYGIPLK